MISYKNKVFQTIYCNNSALKIDIFCCHFVKRCAIFVNFKDIREKWEEW